MQDIYRKILNKPTVDEIYYNFFTRYISAFLTKLVFNLPISPNLVSCLMFISGIGGLYFLSLTSTLSILVSGLLFITHNILDTLDGDLARARSQTTKFGKFIDLFTHSIINPFIFLALFFRFKEQTEFSSLFILCGFIFLIDMYLKKNFDFLTKNKFSFSIRKKNKASYQLLKIKLLKLINDICFSIIGLYHILIIIFFIDFFIFENFGLIYLTLFSIIVIIKFLIRLIIMSRILIKLN